MERASDFLAERYARGEITSDELPRTTRADPGEHVTAWLFLLRMPN
jgi:hypothetical protein